MVKYTRDIYFSKQLAVEKRNPKVLFNTVNNIVSQCNDFLRIFFFQDKINGLRGNIAPLDSPFNHDLPHPIIMESFDPVCLKYLLEILTQMKPSKSPTYCPTYFSIL